MSAVDSLSTYFGRLYETWGPDQQAGTANPAAAPLGASRRTRRDVGLQTGAGRSATAHKAKLAAAGIAEKVARDQQRGHAVDFKRVVMAYAVEGVVASTSAYGQYLLALHYGTDWLTTQQMVWRRSLTRQSKFVAYLWPYQCGHTGSGRSASWQL